MQDSNLRGETPQISSQMPDARFLEPKSGYFSARNCIRPILESQGLVVLTSKSKRFSNSPKADASLAHSAGLAWLANLCDHLFTTHVMTTTFFVLFQSLLQSD